MTCYVITLVDFTSRCYSIVALIAVVVSICPSVRLLRCGVNRAMFPRGRTDCDFGAISRSISETVQASTKVTIECEYEVLCDLSNGIISSDFERPLTRVSSKANVFYTA